MTGRRGSDAEVEVLVSVHPHPAAPPAIAIAVAMRESDAWCAHVDAVRRAFAQRIREERR